MRDWDGPETFFNQQRPHLIGDVLGANSAVESSIQLPKQTLKPGALVSKAIDAYDGSINFNLWLNLFTTTHSKLEAIKKVLYHPARSGQYIQTLGLDPNPRTCGEMAGRIVSMLPAGMLREIYIKNADNLYQDEKDFKKDCGFLRNFFGIRPDNLYFVMELKGILRSCPEFVHLSPMIISRYFGVKEPLHIKNVYVKCLWRSFYNELKILLSDKNKPVDFVAAYCIGFLNKIYALNLANEYWTEETCFDKLVIICSFYRRFIPEDTDFVNTQIPYAFSRFLHKREITQEIMHNFYIKRKIFLAALHHVPLPDIIDELIQYEKDTSFSISVHPQPFKAVYTELPYQTLLWANVYLDNVLVLKRKPSSAD